MKIDRSRFIQKFVTEAKEHIEKLNNGLLHLEESTTDQETIHELFRSAHTIKGSARMMKLTQVADLAHGIEDILDSLRSGKAAMTKDLADLLFKGVDALCTMVNRTGEGQPIEAVEGQLCKELEKARAEKEYQAQASGPRPPGPEPAPSLRTCDTVRIDADRLDELVKLTGEMVSHFVQMKEIQKSFKALLRETKKSATGPTAPERSSPALYNRINELYHQLRNGLDFQETLTSGLQEVSLSLRMLPLSMVFDTFKRPVRDLATALGKKVDLAIEGSETELDKKLIEKIGDPLLHLVRNAIDHGIELPEERMQAGKEEKGRLTICAYQDSGNVAIEIRDDGKGISLEKIRETALKKNLATRGVLDTMTVAQTRELIFAPGFSTSEIITDFSGRGVGMDVVKRNIMNELHGTVHIESEEGKGTAFILTLPMTLAITRVMLVSVGGMVFATPSRSIEEALRIPLSELFDVVDKKALRLRDHLIAVEYLATLLGLPTDNNQKDGTVLVLVARQGSERMGLIIDDIVDEENLVIKALPKHMQGLPLVSGVAISGTNTLINLLSVSKMIEIAKEIRTSPGKPENSDDEVNQPSIHILVVDDSPNTREIEKSILESYGYTVTLAGDGEEGFVKAMESAFDLIVTDIEMPVMDGFTLTEKLRGTDRYKSTPIVIVTSRESEADKRRGIQSGADAYILKGSFEQSNLLDTIQNLTG